jgi:hypothetical protein
MGEGASRCAQLARTSHVPLPRRPALLFDRVGRIARDHRVIGPQRQAILLPTGVDAHANRAAARVVRSLKRARIHDKSLQYDSDKDCPAVMNI